MSRIRSPFLVILGLLFAVSVIAVNSLSFGRMFTSPTPSMAPAVDAGDRVFVLRPIFSGDLRRGDIVAFRFPANPTQSQLKRIVGLPGDRIRIVNKTLWLNGKAVPEPYVQHATTQIEPYRDNFPAEPSHVLYPGGLEMLRDNVRNGELVVPVGDYFVMGDNRDLSLDSRYWGFVRRDEMLGRPVLLFGKGNRDSFRYPLGG